MKRSESVDIGRAVCLIMVLFAHSCGFPYLVSIFASFYMMFFFFVSGICSNGKIESAWKKTKKTLCEYFAISLILFISAISIKLLNNELTLLFLKKAVIGILYGRMHILDGDDGYLIIYNMPLWFLPCFALAVYFNSILCSIKKLWVRISSIVLCLTSGYALSFLPFSMPWSIEVALVGTAVMQVASLLKSHFLKICELPLSYRIIVLLPGVPVLLFLIHLNGEPNTSLGIWGGAESCSVPLRAEILYFVNSVLGSGLFLIICSLFKEFKAITTSSFRIAEASVFILGFHLIIIRFITKVEVVMLGYDRSFGLLGIMNVAMTMAVCLLLRKIYYLIEIKRGNARLM